jgi:hypothetical protein
LILGRLLTRSTSSTETLTEVIDLVKQTGNGGGVYDDAIIRQSDKVQPQPTETSTSDFTSVPLSQEYLNSLDDTPRKELVDRVNKWLTGYEDGFYSDESFTNEWGTSPENAAAIIQGYSGAAEKQQLLEDALAEQKRAEIEAKIEEEKRQLLIDSGVLDTGLVPWVRNIDVPWLAVVGGVAVGGAVAIQFRNLALAFGSGVLGGFVTYQAEKALDDRLSKIPLIGGFFK